MNNPTMYQDSPTWLFFVWASFVISVFLMCVGIYYMPVVLWIKGYLIMGLFFALGSTFTLSKTLRDNHEAKKLLSKISEVKTEKMLQEFEASR